MALEVVKLQTSLDASQQSAVERLEEFLEKARAGEIKAVAIAATRTDGGIVSSYSARAHLGPLLGALVNLQHRLCSEGV